MKSTLELFEIACRAVFSALAASTTRASSGASARSTAYCGGYYEPSVRRGLFLDDVVYSISYGGVLANNATSLAPLRSFTLPQPQLQSYPGCAVDVAGK